MCAVRCLRKDCWGLVGYLLFPFHPGGAPGSLAITQGNFILKVTNPPHTHTHKHTAVSCSLERENWTAGNATLPTVVPTPVQLRVKTAVWCVHLFVPVSAFHPPEKEEAYGV